MASAPAISTNADRQSCWPTPTAASWERRCTTANAALPGSQYIAAVLIDHRFRHHGYGRELLVAVIGDALMRSGRQYVNWVVDPMNDVMLRLSREVGMNSVRTRMDTFSSFIHDASGADFVRLAA